MSVMMVGQTDTDDRNSFVYVYVVSVCVCFYEEVAPQTIPLNRYKENTHTR
jgi:hypothetical protein